jgi:hypothetical protein
MSIVKVFPVTMIAPLHARKVTNGVFRRTVKNATATPKNIPASMNTSVDFFMPIRSSLYD